MTDDLTYNNKIIDNILGRVIRQGHWQLFGTAGLNVSVLDFLGFLGFHSQHSVLLSSFGSATGSPLYPAMIITKGCELEC